MNTEDRERFRRVIEAKRNLEHGTPDPAVASVDVNRPGQRRMASPRPNRRKAER